MYTKMENINTTTEPETVCNHEPDLSSVSTSFDYGTLYVDVNCRHCGQSGCVAAVKETDNIEW